MTATPPALNNQKNITFQRGETSQSYFFPTQNPDGSALDVSSGFTAKVNTLSNPPALNETPASDTSNLAYSSTGVTWTPSASGFVRSAYDFVVLLSEDSFSTQTRIAHGKMNVLPGDADTIGQL